jgi:hypothetical protein
MRRWIATGLLVAVLDSTLPTLALASSAGRRNTALGLTAGAIYTWLNGGTNHAGRRNTALLLTAGSVYAWSRFNQAKKAERREARLTRYYRDRYYGGGPGYSSYRRTAYYSSNGPYSRVRGYRSSYSRGGYSNRRRRHGSTYLAGYRAGYRRGMQVCRVRHRRGRTA